MMTTKEAVYDRFEIYPTSSWPIILSVFLSPIRLLIIVGILQCLQNLFSKRVDLRLHYLVDVLNLQNFQTQNFFLSAIAPFRLIWPTIPHSTWSSSPADFSIFRRNLQDKSRLLFYYLVYSDTVRSIFIKFRPVESYRDSTSMILFVGILFDEHRSAEYRDIRFAIFGNNRQARNGKFQEVTFKFFSIWKLLVINDILCDHDPIAGTSYERQVITKLFAASAPVKPPPALMIPPAGNKRSDTKVSCFVYWSVSFKIQPFLNQFINFFRKSTSTFCWGVNLFHSNSPYWILTFIFRVALI